MNSFRVTPLFLALTICQSAQAYYEISTIHGRDEWVAPVVVPVSSTLSGQSSERLMSLSPGALGSARSKFSGHALYRLADITADSISLRNEYFKQHPALVGIDIDADVGVYSGRFLSGLLADLDNASLFAYHHQQDKDYRRWRAIVDKASVSAPALRQQLQSIDRRIALIATPIDPAWLPDSVPVVAVLSHLAILAKRADVIVCVDPGNARYRQAIKSFVDTDLANVVMVATPSEVETTKKVVSGTCALGFVNSRAKINKSLVAFLQRPLLETDVVEQPIQLRELKAPASSAGKVSGVLVNKVWRKNHAELYQKIVQALTGTASLNIERKF